MMLTPRFRALILFVILFAVAGIPVGILHATWEAWRTLPHVGEGIGFWSLAIGYAVDSSIMFTLVFSLVGLAFGLILSAAGRGRPVQRAGRFGAVAGTTGGVMAGIIVYYFGGWWRGEPVSAWVTGAAMLGAMGALTGATLGGLAFRLASRMGALGGTVASGTKELPSR